MVLKSVFCGNIRSELSDPASQETSQQGHEARMSGKSELAQVANEQNGGRGH